MKRLLALATVALNCYAQAQLPPPVASEIKFPRQPSLSPDGRKVAFSWQGDIWTVGVDGGTASRVTIHEAHDQYPAWSPDGRWIAFSSKREGNYDVWVVPVIGGTPRQLTYHTADDLVYAWSPDGGKILFGSVRENNRTSALYMVDVKTGATREVAEDIMPVSQGVFSPDGKEIYYTRGGSWTRKGYRGSAQSDLMACPSSGGAGRMVTRTPENERWPQLDAKGSLLVFMSDKDGTSNLWKRSAAGGEASQLTHFRDGNVFFPALSRDGQRVIFEHNFQLWTVDTKGGQPRALSILAPTDLKSNPVRRETFTTGAQEARLSPDGKQIAFVVHGEVFVMPSAGGDSIRLTKTPAREQEIAWTPDGKKLTFISDRDGNGDLYVVDVAGKATTQLTKTPGTTEAGPSFSPDGKQLAFLRGMNGQALIVMPAGGGAEKVVATGPTMSDIAWSPDSKWLAFGRMKSHSAGTVSEIWVVPAGGGKATNVTRWPVVNTNPTWSPDGKKLFFITNRTTQNQLFSTALRDEKNEEGEEAAKPAGKPGPVDVKIDFEDIQLRAKQITRTDTGITGYTISPDSKTVIYAAAEGGRPDIYRIAADGGAAARITASGEAGLDLHFASDGSRVIYRSGGGIRSLSLGPPAPSVSPVAFSARMDIDVRAEMLQMFDEAWRKMRDGFYDEKMHGCDWNGLRDRYRPVVADLTHKEDFYALFTLALGELNASHTGIGPNPAPGSTATLGVALDEDFPGPGVKVKSVLPKGPADMNKSRLKPGDIVLKVDGEAVANDEDFYRQMLDRAGKAVGIIVNDKPGDAGARTVKITPITQAAHKTLEYDRWTHEREAMVDKLSGGRLGYLHLDAMGPAQLERFRRATLGDMEEKDGLVLDVRFNGGGSIADEMFNLLENRVFGYRTLRGDPARLPSPMPAFTKPVIVLANELSFSNAEVFPWGFKALKLGKVVGMPTFGAVIGTGATDLIDGTPLRMPAVGSYTMDGENMENHGCPPDIQVEPTPEDIYAKRDPQVERAVKELLGQVGGTRERK